MKKAIFLAAIVACFALSKAQAQTVNGIKLSELNASYMDVREAKPILSKKTWVRLDYGQKVTDENKTAIVKDDKDKPFEYNSMMDFINQMAANGYELYQVYYYRTYDDYHEKVYILKKK